MPLPPPPPTATQYNDHLPTSTRTRMTTTPKQQPRSPPDMNKHRNPPPPKNQRQYPHSNKQLTFAREFGGFPSEVLYILSQLTRRAVMPGLNFSKSYRRPKTKSSTTSQFMVAGENGLPRPRPTYRVQHYPAIGRGSILYGSPIQ